MDIMFPRPEKSMVTRSTLTVSKCSRSKCYELWKRAAIVAAFFCGTTGVYCHEYVKGFTTGITEIQGAQESKVRMSSSARRLRGASWQLRKASAAFGLPSMLVFLRA